MRDPHYIPKPTKHRSGQAVVRLNGRDFYLGKFGTPAARGEYERLVAEWLANGRRTPQDELTVNDLILGFLDHAAAYYKNVGDKSGEIGGIKDALKVVKRLYGRAHAGDFGPKALKVVRDEMVKAGWCRKYVNHQVDRVRRMFRWATEEEFVPGTVYHALKAVKGIRKGTPGVRESAKVKPVGSKAIRAVLSLVPPVIAAMIRFQYHTGCRPEEVCRLRRSQIRRRGKVWLHVPTEHKTEHHGIERRIYIGPKAQRVLRPWLDAAPDAFIFSPIQAEAHRNAERRKVRQSPLTPSQAARRPRKDRKRPPGESYTTASYRRAIHRACKLAKIEKWSPNQLRHTAATRIRKKHGIELARIVLGHTNLATTQIYAEADLTKALDVMGQFG